MGRPKAAYIDYSKGKFCRGCNLTKDLSEFYMKNYNGDKRPYSRCKLCSHAITNQYHKENKDKVKEYNRKSLEKPGAKERRNAKRKEWDKANPDKVKAKAQKYLSKPGVREELRNKAREKYHATR